MTGQTVTLFHAPQTRSSGVLTLLEELNAPYEIEVLDRSKGEHQLPSFLAINPLGKVPALRDAAGQIVTEQVAIFLYLADLFPGKHLAPAVGDVLRGPYLRWMIFYAASFEPAVVDRARGHEPGNHAMSPYGSFDKVIDMLTATLTGSAYLLGQQISAADILWGTALRWTIGFKLVPEHPRLVEYSQAIAARPAAERAREIDAALIGRKGG